MSARYYYSIFVRHILWKRILPYGKNNCCSLVARLPLPRFIDVSSISHYPNRNGGNNNRTSILNRARIILVSPSLIARSRFAALRFPPSLSIVDELSGMFLNWRATCNTSDVSDFFLRLAQRELLWRLERRSVRNCSFIPFYSLFFSHI